MIDFSITHLFPEFLLADKNGFAMARAIEKALQIMCDTIQTGVDNVQDVEKMPEWRLDEMAWELGCLYDYSADIEAKRSWIRDATPLFAAYGTPQAIYNYLEGFFDSVEVEEYWQYGGKPFHFRVTVSGEWTHANEAWARMAIAAAKNVRSVLDDLAIGSSTIIIVHGEGQVIARFPYPMTDSGFYAGTWPQENMIGRIVDGSATVDARESKPYRFPYPMAGTKPQEAFATGKAEGVIYAEPEAKGYVFPYPATSEDARSGTIPQENMAAGTADGTVHTVPEATGYVFPYPATSEDARSGTIPQENMAAGTADGTVHTTPEAEGRVFPYPLSGTRPMENIAGALTDAEAATRSDGKGLPFAYPPCASDRLCGEDLF